MTVFERRRPERPFAAALLAALAATLPACGNGSGDAPRPAEGAPADPLLTFQWHLINTGQIADPTRGMRGLAGVDLNVTPVWERGVDGRGVTVAVLDNGVEIGHEDLRANIAHGLSVNYATGNGDPTPAEQRSSHGTMVAGVIAAARNGTGGVGVAPGAKLAGFNILTTQYLSDTVDALGRGMGEHGIAVSNNSWGPESMGMPTPADMMIAEVIRKGVDRGRAGKGIVYVFAAGNSDRDVFEFLDSSASTPLYTPSNFYGYRPQQALTVCAVNANGVAAEYSANGSNLLVCAPSNETADADGTPRAPGITTTEPFGRYSHAFGGTSAAAPAVSGVVALMLQANPELTWRDVRLILARTARVLPSMERDRAAGWIRTGAINPYTDEPYRYSTRYGFGLVDANAAVSYAQRFASVGGSSPSFWESTCSAAFRATDVESGAAASAATVAQSLFVACGSRTVEFLEAEITLEHPNFRALRVTLESPRGTKIVLAPEYPRCERAFNHRGESKEACGTASFGHRYRTHAVIALDEPASGNWTLRIEDALGSGMPVRLRSAILHIT
jgi:subtilisin family serine protease